MKRLAVVILLVFSALIAIPQNPQSILQNCFPSLVLLKCNSPIGYGFFIDKNIIATTYKGISAYTFATASPLGSDKSWAVKGFLFADEKSNVVLLELDYDSGVPLRINTVPISNESKVYILNYSDQNNLSVTEGVFNGIKDFGIIKMMQIKSEISLKINGLPLIDNNGEVIGISTVSPVENPGSSYAVPASILDSIYKNRGPLKSLEMLNSGAVNIDHGNVNTDAGKLKAVSDLLDQGNLRMSGKDYQGAIEKFDQASHIDPMDPDIYVFRGQAKYQLMKYKDAIIDFDKAIEIQSNYAEAYDLRGIAKAELGDKDGACLDWLKAYEYGFNPAFKLLKEFCPMDDIK